MLHCLSSTLLYAEGFSITWITNSITGNCSGYPEMSETPFLPVFPSWDSSTWQDQTVAGKTQERFINSLFFSARKEIFLPTLQPLQQTKCVFSLWLFSASADPSPLEIPQPTVFYSSPQMTGNTAWSRADTKLSTCKERCEKDPKKFAFLYKSQVKISVLFPEIEMFPVESNWMVSRENPHQFLPVQVPTSIAPRTWISSLAFSTNWIYLQELLKNLFVPQLRDPAGASGELQKCF